MGGLDGLNHKAYMMTYFNEKLLTTLGLISITDYCYTAMPDCDFGDSSLIARYTGHRDPL